MKNIIFLFIFIPSLLAAQSWQWAKQYGSNTPGTQDKDKEYISKMQQDEAGNIYIAGRLLGSAKWEGTAMPNYGSGGRGFIAKYDCDGNLLWRNLIGVNQGDYVRDFVVDAQQNVYLTGVSFHQNLPSYFRFNDSLIAPINAGSYYLLKLKPNGSLEWLKVTNFAAGLPSELLALENDIYHRVGTFGVTNNLPIYGGFPLLPPDKLYMLKIDGAGNLLTSKSFNNRGYWGGYIRITPDREFIEAQYYEDSTIINGNIYASTYPTAIYVHSDSNLNTVSVKSATPADTISKGCNFADLRQVGENVYLYMGIARQTEYDTYHPSFYATSASTYPPALLKCDIEGNVKWAINPDSIDAPNGIGFGSGAGIRLGKDGTPYLTAKTFNKLKIMDVSYTPPVSGVNIPYILRVDTSGNHADLVATIQTTTFNQGNGIKGVEISEKGDIFVAGEVKDNLTFGATTLQNANPGSMYGFDCFLAKYGYACTDSNALVPPLQPQNLIATGDNAQQQIAITWQDISNIEWGYTLYRSTNGTNWNSIATLAENTTTYTDNNVSANTVYHYKVAAYNNIGEIYSNSDTAKVSTVGIEAPNYQGLVTLYPNPNKGIFSLEIDSQSAEQGTFTLWDMTGKKAVEQAFKVPNGISKTGFYFPNLAKGTYIAQLRLPSGTWQQKMIVE